MIRICVFLYRTCGLPTLEAVTACQVRVAALCSGPTPSLSTRLHKPCSCSSSKVVYVQASSCMHFSLIYAYGGICTHLQSIADLVYVLIHYIFCQNVPKSASLTSLNLLFTFYHTSVTIVLLN